MTPKQKECLDTIERLTVDGIPPSFDELRMALGLASKSGVHRLVHALAERGHLSFRPDKKRTMRLASREAEAIPFDRMAEAAMQHVRVRFNLGKPVTVATVRAALVEAFAAGANG